MVVACHLGGRLGMDLGLIVVFEGWVDFLAQSLERQHPTFVIEDLTDDDPPTVVVAREA